MNKISRKDLLKAGGVSAAGGLLAVSSATPAGADEEVRRRGVQIHGTVSNADFGLSLALSVTVHGPNRSLSGSGWDFAPPDVSGACHFTQEGTRLGSVVSLSGFALFANTPGDLGATVATEANLETDEITWTFTAVGGEPFVFTGIGTVIAL